MPVRIKLSSYNDVKVFEKSTVKVPIVHFQAAVTFLELVDADFNALHNCGLNISHRVRHRDFEFDDLGLLLSFQGLCDCDMEPGP